MKPFTKVTFCIALVISAFFTNVPATTAAFRMTALQFAELSSSGTADEIQGALNAGADMNQDALIMAAGHNPDPNVIKIIIAEAKKQGVNIVNMRGSLTGTTALYEAASSNNIDVIRALFEAGADANMKVRNETPLDHAQNGYTQNSRNPYIADLIADYTQLSTEDQYNLRDYFHKKDANTLALKWFRKAADNGHANAQNQVGFMYSAGIAVGKDDSEAVKWYRKAADQGLALAQFNLGVCLDRGIGITQDYKQAAEWYQKAAEQGRSDALKYLADMYFDGRGVQQNYSEALNLYKEVQSYKNGYQPEINSEVCIKIGRMYEEGKGIKQDYIEAFKWYEKAYSDKGRENIVRLFAEYAKFLEKNAKKLSDINLSPFFSGDARWDGDGYATDQSTWNNMYKLLEQEAKKGNASAQCFVGLVALLQAAKTMPGQGWWQQAKMKEAGEWLEKADKQGNGLAKKLPELIKAEASQQQQTSSSSSSSNANGTIKGDKVNIRTRPSTSAKVVKQLNTGHPVNIIEKKGDWVHIKTASGTEGWVFGKYVKY